jgi:hypothetical protein
MSMKPIKSRVGGQATPSVGIAGLLVLVVSLAAGCASLQCAALEAPLETGKTQDAPIAVEAETPTVSTARVPPKAAAEQDPVGLNPERAAVDATRESHQVRSTPSKDVAIKPAIPAVKPSVTRPTEPAVAKVELPAVNTPAEVAATPVAKVASATTAQAQKKAIATPGPAKPEGAPPLDMKSLETRLKETKAIGLLTKITLKNQHK